EPCRCSALSLCTCSSRYNSKVSFHRFPVDIVVRQHWLTKIRRQDFSPRRVTRVCSRHFLPDDLLETPRGKRCLKKGAFPFLFEWNNYPLPVPRPSVWERRPREEEATSPAAAAPTVDCSEMVFVAPEHDYCVSPGTSYLNNLCDVFFPLTGYRFQVLVKCATFLLRPQIKYFIKQIFLNHCFH
uniref:THAP domain-containing protein 1 n=1 Tax=Cyprinodon variegatus TaxID=28743 RepID=A0A3Q2DS82_CYPVA